MGLKDWFQVNKKPSKEVDLVRESSEFGELDKACRETTGAGLAFFHCPNKCVVEYEGKEGVLQLIVPANTTPTCSKCKSQMVPTP